MSQRLVFWISNSVRILLVLLATVFSCYFWGVTAGLIVGMLAMLVLVLVQLFYLQRLAEWLDHPSSARLPDGWGAWTDIFSRLYKLRRGDEKSQAELTEWLARFRQAMTLLPDGVVIMDDVLFLEWCNPAAERHLGLSLSQDKGMRVTNLVRSPQFMDYIILGRYETPLTLSFRDRKLIAHIIPFENRRQILVTHDVTESERIDMMRRDFIANASHELRTPLTVINGFLEIASLQADLDVPTRNAHLKLMSEQGERMQRLVEDMLTLTRLESMDHLLRAEVVNMRALLEQIMQEAHALSAGRHQITLECDGPDIRGSTDEIRSALTNLVTNAIRYTPEHGQIQLLWQMTEAGPKFSVRDNGIGISPNHISRLTERFYRVDKSRSRETQGTGLGLAIVKHVLLRHSAQLLIESTPDVGSQFSAQFPCGIIATPQVATA
ncbi:MULTISPECIES: phosphate regulon sensor histidine kinase PhoR [unclassified Undibacterium]|uniref:phosphate regulon sensor histidine kinase PhoR n=3 Tax=Pseudomonadota TaxID=1224 RepID=UPI002AC8ED90|nr:MULTISPECIES: phosphate regulon sensor histidine kinase PhoR [unclassified Undibacterium]MEB0139220.1 phosphate regulon sensor histidine kinase PhoR [Undibacterium sp. CCC2.1]MEB0172205.1 phosphate regulon sensor histidine kinase PhoR [Undibacterium sp. CCC1.1]MEB0175938.1 phosphate regulon sensor histidine kinase PhoR [Undibacterium sp. CCC3.4]MEB0215202.1 phosphate regulon sensor histidine kinase PhoR [Undibacterium sp. 5I2]WPX43505.1 phosphate regulon sensor histidine kinase PhoR [Undiba